MPWPKPKPDETESEFISRCMANEYIQQDIPTRDQRLAVCYDRWENRDKGGSTMELQRKSFTGIELKKDKPGLFTARIATLNVVDKDGDLTLTGAFPDGKEILISSYQHGSWMGALPVGKGVIHERGDEVIVEGEFNLKSSTGKEHYETVKFAPELQEWSYGFIVTKEGDETDWPEKVPGRILKSLDVFETSPVLRGAGVDTALLAIKNENQGVAFKVQAEAALAAVNDLVTRAKSLADLRRKEGRDISLSSRQEMVELRESVIAAQKEIDNLLARPEPPAADKSGRAELHKAMRLLNEIYGGTR